MASSRASSSSNPPVDISGWECDRDAPRFVRPGTVPWQGPTGDPPSIGFVDEMSLPFMSDRVAFGYKSLAFAADVRDPGFFHVNFRDTWKWFEKEIKTGMQEWYDELEYYSAVKPRPTLEYLIQGTNVVAFYDGSAGKEYCRAKVLRRVDVDGEAFFRVFLFDYGREMTVPRSYLRYMEPFFMRPLPAQAVRCRVLIGLGDQASQNMTWSQEEKLRFFDMIKDQTLLVHFVNEGKVLGETVWDVFIHTYDIRAQRISKFHIERALLEEFPRQGFGFELEDLIRRKLLGVFGTDFDPQPDVDPVSTRQSTRPWYLQ